MRTLYDKIELPHALTNGEESRRATSRLREIVGDEYFSQAWDDGRALTLYQALELALDKNYA